MKTKEELLLEVLKDLIHFCEPDECQYKDQKEVWERANKVLNTQKMDFKIDTVTKIVITRKFLHVPFDWIIEEYLDLEQIEPFSYKVVDDFDEHGRPQVSIETSIDNAVKYYVTPESIEDLYNKFVDAIS